MKTGLGLKKKLKGTKSRAGKLLTKLRVMNKPKVFCIGLNKTGTTSLKEAMHDLGYVIGNQHQAELLFDDWVIRDFGKLIKYIRTAEFFQDVPLSYPYTYVALDQAFPNSKFILTVRDTPEQWYNSLVTFHGNLYANGKIPPQVADLKKANYVYEGFPYIAMKKVMNLPDDKLYDKKKLIERYLLHNQTVMDYFRFRKDDLLVLNVAEKGAYKRLCSFLNKECKDEEFPWVNKT